MLRNRVRLKRRGARVELDVAGASFSSWHPRLLMTGLAWDAITAGSLLRPGGPPATVLMLGLGGGTVARQLAATSPCTRVTAVELDEGVVAMAREHMGLDRLGVEAVIGDAYEFVERDRRRFDVVIDDLYVTGREDVWRPRPPDGGLLAQYRRRLAPGGLVLVNLVIGPGHRRIQGMVRQAMGAAFRDVRSVRPPLGLNEILVGGDGVLGRGTLREFGARLVEPEDRRLWDRIRVRRLG
ncbi:MAG: methyltransferase domain-containing protein [Verrucomicrobiae bacterium]|nr:methyltransferase domain-containing protein [Verrucomicrobiae bacterium]